MATKPQPPDDLWEALEKAKGEATVERVQSAHPGPEWFSIYDYCNRYKSSRNAAVIQLSRLVVENKLETKMFVVFTLRDGVGEVRRQMRFYRLKT